MQANLDVINQKQLKTFPNHAKIEIKESSDTWSCESGNLH